MSYKTKNRGKLYFVSMSGGKDSTATAIYMLNKYPLNKLRFIFADTKWEHPKTYEYLKYLEKRLGIKIRTVTSHKYDGMEDLCVSKKSFPQRTSKFCTTELKILPIIEIFKEYQELGFTVISVVGIRKEESKSRSGEGMWKFAFFKINKKHLTKRLGVVVYQPIVNWDTQEVFDFHKKNNVKPNPLYLEGYERVGCYPCINASVTEKGLLEHFAVDRLSKLEEKVSRVVTYAEKATFFYEHKKPVGIKEIKKKRNFNSLGFDLGCMNQYGACE